MLERLDIPTYYCFLDFYSRYNQIGVDPSDQEKTAFTCIFEVFVYCRIPFSFCNAPTIFQRCMLSIFSNVIGNSIDAFMDEFLCSLVILMFVLITLISFAKEVLKLT